MATIHVVLDDELLRVPGRAMQRAKVSRSAFVRKALQEHLRRLNMKELEASERRAINSSLRTWKKLSAGSG
ncbi:MAG TPA: hypothetical protein VFZ27_06910 [Terriglobia bacterium]|nr:hypothetical protein [Terriglobia bacterium]